MSLDQRHPGLNVSRPISAPPTFRISATPLGNVLTSSGVRKVRCSVLCSTCCEVAAMGNLLRATGEKGRRLPYRATVVIFYLPVGRRSTRGDRGSHGSRSSDGGGSG